MNKEDRDILRHISETLDEVLAVLSKQPNKLMRVLEITAIVFSCLSILSIIDIIMNWMGG